MNLKTRCHATPSVLRQELKYVYGSPVDTGRRTLNYDNLRVQLRCIGLKSLNSKSESQEPVFNPG